MPSLRKDKQTETDKQTGRENETERQTERQTEREGEREKQVDKKKHGWLIGSILWLVASMASCFY